MVKEKVIQSFYIVLLILCNTHGKNRHTEIKILLYILKKKQSIETNQKMAKMVNSADKNLTQKL